MVSKEFQSTSPQGRRLQGEKGDTGDTDFNPRLRKGDDIITVQVEEETLKISIHVSARETTSPGRYPNAFKVISIHVSARETT